MKEQNVQCGCLSEFVEGRESWGEVKNGQN